MWDGPGPGPRPRGGPHFRGDHREERFAGRDRPDFRGRDGMNMGPMGPMGARPFDMPPMDMRKMDGPPMRGRDMDSRDMGRRDFYRHGEDPDFPFRRQVEISVREKNVNTSNAGRPGRNPNDTGGRNLPPREAGGRFMDMDRDKDGFEFDRPPFHNDGRRGFPMDRMDRNDGFRDQRERSPMGMRHNDGYDMDMPPHDRRDMDRRGGPPFNPRGGFESDMDFRNRSGPVCDFRGRGQTPSRFGNDPPVERRRPHGGDPQTTVDVSNNDGGNSPLTDYRCGEEMTLAEEWKKRNKDKKPLVNFPKGFGNTNEPRFPSGFGSDGNVRAPLPFPERDRVPLDYPPKDFNFPPHFPPMDLPGRQEHMQSHKDRLNRENEGKPWLEERDPKHVQPNQEKTQPPPDSFKDISHIQGTDRTKINEEDDFSSSVQPRDQDYRDIDYRTAAPRTFDFKPEDFQTPEKLIKESEPPAPSQFPESTSQDQDYRGAAVKEQVSNTVSIIGIPKTATVEQILGAFTTPDGVPIQGMKIKNVVPGYSYDTAIVEFLNLEDAVHFMESNKGSLKVGTKVVSMKFVHPEECEITVQESDHNIPQPHEPPLRPIDHPEELKTSVNGSKPGLAPPNNSAPQWQRSSDLTPEAWQRQVDQQQEVEPREPWANRNPPSHHQPQTDSVFKDSKTMIIKNVKPTTTVETILKALDPFAYLDERNVRLVKAKTPGAKCFCFVDMDSHEQVQRLVELLTKPRPLYIDGVRVYAEVAKPLKNQAMMNRKEFDIPPPGNSSILGNPPLPNMLWPPPPQQKPPPQQPLMPPSQYMPPMPPPVSVPTEMQGGIMPGTSNPPLSLHPSISQGVGFGETHTLNPLYQLPPSHVPTEPAGMVVPPESTQSFVYTPDVNNYLYDATSGFYYDPETTLYYDPNSRYFYNAETQDYLYWEPVSKTYIPVPGGHSAEGQPVAMTAEDQAILSNPAADAPLEMKKPPTVPQTPVSTPQPTPPAPPSVEPDPVPVTVAPPLQDKREEEDLAKKDKDNKDEKPKSRAAVKIMKDMERWAKIQNRQKESSRNPSPLLRGDDDKRQSKSADAGFAVFERKISGSDELFKKPFAPTKKDEKSKRSMGSLGMLASDYGAGSDEEVEEDKEDPKAAKNSNNHSERKEDKLTDWKKMACLLCRRQFPNKDALVRHQQLSDLHKQNMEIHLKIKRSKKELEALENQEKELNARVPPKSPPEMKRRKQQQHQDDWAGSSRESNKGSERPGLGAEPSPKKKKKPAVYDHASYQQAVRKAMFARYKELE